MRKLTVLAMVAAVLMAGAVFGRTIHPNATFAFGVGGAAAGPSTTNNDDSCDIGTAPAATLLLPYFEVDFKSPQTTARTTLFTITNVSNLPQIAHVVLWTDWSFAALDFNIFLTGYDVQGINLYDIFSRGQIAPPSGTSASTTVPTNPTAGSQPAANNANANITSLANCSSLASVLPPGIVADLDSVFTTGKSTGNLCSNGATVGGTHANAVGYLTVDVVASCNTSLVALDPGYFTSATFGGILFDNVLIGDYQDINPNPATGNFAGGNPMVHIRAVPEGGPAGSCPAPGCTNLPYTFYDRYTPAANSHIDRRQPLPALWAARYIAGGTGAFNTNYKIWREGSVVAQCSSSMSANSVIPVTEIVRFDEHENASITTGGVIFSPPPAQFGLPETSSQPVSGGTFPAIPNSGDVAGWMYLNLNSGLMRRTAPISATAAAAGVVAGTTPRASQNWVIVSMSAEGRYQVDFDAAWLGNGCSAPVAAGATIGPAGGVLVCPQGTAGCTPGVAPFTGTNTTPP
jgi:hypothetical protein